MDTSVTETEIEKSMRSLREAMGECVDACGLFERVQLLISQRDNANNEAEAYKQKLVATRREQQAMKDACRDAIETLQDAIDHT